MHKLPLWLLPILLLGIWLFRQELPGTGTPSAPASIATQAEAIGHVRDSQPLPDFLPPEAHDTLRLIARGGPFPHRQDGSVFGNRESRLPAKPRGWYHEYTVETPRLNHRGARRIVTGGTPPGEFWYTDDHYDSFRRFDVDLETLRHD